MPRKHPLPESELVICRRLIELRGNARLSRAELVRLSGLQHDLITRVELGRMPLRYGDAVRWLPALVLESPTRSPVNPLWIIDHRQPKQVTWPLLLPKPEYIGIPPRTRFSKFVADHLELLKGLAKNPPEGDLPKSWIFPYNAHLIAWQCNLRRMERGVDWLRALWEHSAQRFVSSSPEIAQMLRYQAGAGSREIVFDNITLWSDNAGVKSEIRNMQELIRRLCGATAQRGMKAKLARAMNVPLQRVSEWLHRSKEPSGDTTFRLLRWVQQQEGKQKGPGSAETLPERKAQSAKVSYEKRKPKPVKR